MKYIKPQQNIISKFILQCGEAKIYANEKKKNYKIFQRRNVIVVLVSEKVLE